VVVHDQRDGVDAVPHRRLELLHVHQEAAVAVDGEHGRFRPRELGAERGGKREAERAEVERRQEAAWPRGVQAVGGGSGGGAGAAPASRATIVSGGSAPRNSAYTRWGFSGDEARLRSATRRAWRLVRRSPISWRHSSLVRATPARPSAARSAASVPPASAWIATATGYVRPRSRLSMSIW